MRFVGALIIFAVITIVMVPFIGLVWKDRPKRGDNYQVGGYGSGGDGPGWGHDGGGHGGGDGGGH